MLQVDLLDSFFYNESRTVTSGLEPYSFYTESVGCVLTWCLGSSPLSPSSVWTQHSQCFRQPHTLTQNILTIHFILFSLQIQPRVEGRQLQPSKPFPKTSLLFLPTNPLFSHKSRQTTEFHVSAAHKTFCSYLLPVD